ncbi:MAG: hypothetical protein AMDU1_APLC00005G0060 [Thermoplasmatales archaeon A-plasma]|nr:MAG: hypothetical protein AMDU1_APLC00005G0060 [Thermoplasmatales archaeon A-plasma]
MVMPVPEEILREISYWNGFRDALEIALLKPDKTGLLHSRAIEKIEDMKRILKALEAKELIESQSRPSEILQDQEGHDTSKEVI